MIREQLAFSAQAAANKKLCAAKAAEVMPLNIFAGNATL